MIEIDDKRLPQRFWDKVIPEPNSGCWLWTAGVQVGGYGAFNTGPRVTVAHRASYEALVGPVPDGLQLDHLCRTRCCVNPAHLEPVTSAENTRRGLLFEMQRKRFESATHCRNGHPRNAENLDLRTQVSPKGKIYPYRRCVACSKLTAARQRAKRKEASYGHLG